MSLVLDLLLVFCASFAKRYAQLKDFTLKERNKRVELDALMNPTLSLITVGCPDEPDSLPHYSEGSLLYNVLTSVSEHCASAEKPSSLRLDHPHVPTKPPVWDGGDEFH